MDRPALAKLSQCSEALPIGDRKLLLTHPAREEMAQLGGQPVRLDVSHTRFIRWIGTLSTHEEVVTVSANILTGFSSQQMLKKPKGP